MHKLRLQERQEKFKGLLFHSTQRDAERSDLLRSQKDSKLKILSDKFTSREMRIKEAVSRSDKMLGERIEGLVKKQREDESRLLNISIRKHENLQV